LLQRLLGLSGKPQGVSEIGVNIGIIDPVRDRFLVPPNRFRPALMIVREIPERDRGFAG
jgi:hypothetical protein